MKIALFKNKAGKMSEKTLESWMYLILIGVVLLKVVAKLFPIATAAGSELNTSGFPLAEFFLPDGVVWLIVAIFLIMLFIRSFNLKKK